MKPPLTPVRTCCRARSRPRPRGSILVCVLVCMSIAAVLLTTTVQATLQARRQVRTEGQLRQAEWVLLAAVQRAVEKLDASASYTGEVWSLAFETLPDYGPAQVEIKVTATDSEKQKERRIRILVLLPVDAAGPVRRTAEFGYSTPKLPDSPEEP